MTEFAIRATPRSSSNRIDATTDPIRIYVTAAPTDGQANVAILELLAKHLGVPKTSLEIVRGESGRDKVIRTLTLSQDEVSERLKSTKPR